MCEFSGEALEIGVQGQYLTDCINCVHSDNIIIRLIDPTRPILIKDEDDEDKTLVLMPMRIE
jgi:DNA polymerase III sliding clamp (beta) subunit (PCNA family)